MYNNKSERGSVTQKMVATEWHRKTQNFYTKKGDLRTRSLKAGATTVTRLSGKNPAGTSGTTLIT